MKAYRHSHHYNRQPLLSFFLVCWCAALFLLAVLPQTKAVAPAIMFYASSGDVLKVKSELADGVDPMVRNAYGETPLHVSAIAYKKNDVDSMDIIQALLNAGADPSAATDGEYKGHEKRVRRSVLMWFLPHCDVEVTRVLLKAGANVSFVNEEGETALDMARSSGGRCNAVVELLQLAVDSVQQQQQQQEEAQQPTHSEL